ncbi:hypothetical protein PQX77_006843 [Marasmius sp. AFHP31]|nr:hypothetical protein PQX77_006843 [Marasmius sp. AFHP31]
MQWNDACQGTHYNNSGAHQTINHGRDQNINHGRDQSISNRVQIGWQEVNSAGRDIINNVSSTSASSFDRLTSIIDGVGASHKAEQQYERGNCLLGTRVESLRLIYDWRSSREQKSPICWLSGAAGVGKSAIAMTVAQDCENEGFLASSFFFFRSDLKRNNPSKLIPSIAHDLASTTPVIRNDIEQKISKDPKILEATLEEQFRELILEPALSWSRKRLPWGFFTDLPGSAVVSNIVVIDGLDECGDEQTQTRILSIILSAYQRKPHFPLRFLICSRPESWLQEAFADESLSQISNRIVLDDTLAARQDIRRFLVYHFQDIVTCRKYRQVEFPEPWPSKQDLETLVERSCGQFVYVATLVKFLKSASNHPITQLSMILARTPARKSGSSPYRELDALYDIILDMNSDDEEMSPVLSAILILPGHLGPTPANIEWVLGLPSGQVSLTLRGMHSVLNVGDRGDQINLYHTSFRDYLIDQTRSTKFHINIESEKLVIAHKWLKDLTTGKILTYSPNKLYNAKNVLLFTEWQRFCWSISKPSRDLLNDLWNVDLAFYFRATSFFHGESWGSEFAGLISWVKKYRDPGISRNNDQKAGGDSAKAGENTCLEAEGYSSCNKSRAVGAHNREIDKGDRPTLVEGLVHKLLNHPRCFHLEWSSGVPSQNDALYELVRYATRCSSTPLDGPLLTHVEDVHLTDCRCDPSEGSESRDLGHVAYQEACKKLYKAHILLFDTLTRRVAVDNSAMGELNSVFYRIVVSFLLKHCRFDLEVFSLCRTFLKLASSCLVLRISSKDGGEGRKNIAEWIETFPDGFTEEGKSLKAQVLDLPWSRWTQNWEALFP